MENFVSFKLAKLLKENVFDVEDRTKHQMYGNQILPQLEPYNETRWRLYNDYCLAPTIAEVVMWIYKKHGIWLVVNVGKPHNSEIMFYANVIKLGLHHKNKHRTEFHNTPTEAYEAAIKHTLKNLL